MKHYVIEEILEGRWSTLLLPQLKAFDKENYLTEQIRYILQLFKFCDLHIDERGGREFSCLMVLLFAIGIDTQKGRCGLDIKSLRRYTVNGEF